MPIGRTGGRSWPVGEPAVALPPESWPALKEILHRCAVQIAAVMR
ncbi:MULTISPECIES: hypothetical protein [Pseudooceanicola]|nr:MULTISPECIES: hypothetical protein [Pseudooceanicola]